MVIAIVRRAGVGLKLGSQPLEQIAVRFGVSVQDLVAASMLSSPTIRPGDLLFIPNRATPAPK